MINTLKHRALLVTAIFMVATPAWSQAPTDAQRNAIRSQCRADYQAHCASVPPGGAASLQCLQKNMSSLSPGCAGAVRAVEPAAAPKAESAPAAPPKAESTPAAAPKAESTPAAEPKSSAAPAPAAPAATAPAAAAAKPATAAPAAAPKAAAAGTTAKQPTDAQVAAIRSACRSDYQKVCAGVPTGGAPALQCLEQNKAKVSAPCAQAVNAASGGAAPAAAGAAATASPAAAPAAAPAPALVLRPMRPREELFVLRSACSADVRTLCGGVAAGGGRIMQCLATQAGSVSPACREVLAQFAAN